MIDDKYIFNYKNCVKTNEGWLLGSRISVITIYNTKSNNISLSLRKVSGNGNVLFKIDGVEIIKNIFSKKNENFNFSKFKTLEISRPNGSIGQILLLNLIEEDTDLKLKNALSKIEHHGIRLIGSVAYVNNGSWISSANIQNININPKEILIKEGEKYKFIGSGNITDISLYKNINSTKKSEFDKLNFPKIDINEKKTLIENEKIIQNNANDTINNGIIFDSDSSNIFSIYSSVKNKFFKIVNSNGKNFLILKRFGVFSHSISNLESNKEYVIHIHGKKISGNGKLKISLNDFNFNQLNFNNDFCEKIIKLKTLSDANKLNICMSEDGIGEIIISKIIIKSLNDKLKNIEIHKDNNIIDFKLKNNIKENDNFVNENFNDSLYNVREISKNFAIVNKSNYVCDKKVLKPLKIITTSYGARQWISKIFPLFEKLEVVDPFFLFEESSFDNNYHNCDITITSVENLNYISKITFLEETPDNYQFNITQINKLSLSKKIITPSVLDLIKIKSLLPNMCIDIGAKIWPQLNIVNILNKNDACIYFEKNNYLTKRLIKFWKKDYPILYIVGSNLNIDNKNIKHISEYASYEELYKYILNSNILIDFGLNTNYNSGIINLFINLNKKILTNNKYYLPHNFINFMSEKNMSDFNSIFEKILYATNTELNNFIENNYNMFLNTSEK